MFEQLTSGLAFQGQALVARAERQRVIASNIANADTPGYQARDVDFKAAMASAMGQTGYQVAKPIAPGTYQSDYRSNPAHLALKAIGGSSLQGQGDNDLGYTVQSQPAMDNNSVELDRERANFVDNSVRYEATLRFINGSSKSILTAITGQ
jgi:flagellar basal-body rod protein FlgB